MVGKREKGEREEGREGGEGGRGEEDGWKGRWRERVILLKSKGAWDGTVIYAVTELLAKGK